MQFSSNNTPNNIDYMLPRLTLVIVTILSDDFINAVFCFLTIILNSSCSVWTQVKKYNIIPTNIF